MRTLVFTGKGGVGKTTVAAATALRAAADGARTLAISTDPAHSLADAFEIEVGHEPGEITRNLFAQQVDSQLRMEEGWGEVRDHLIALLDWSGVESIEAEELAVLPGLDEVFALADIASYDVSREWDVLVVDSAPTAETLRLLSLPEVLRWWMNRLWPTGRKVARVVRPVLNRVTSMPLASDEVMDAAEDLFDRLDAARQVLADNKRSSVRLVLNPEKMVVAEARRMFTYLSLFGYGVDAVIANRVLPDAVGEYFADWKRAQSENLTAVREAFDPLPVIEVPFLAEEPVGLGRLNDLAGALYSQRSPTELMFHREPMAVSRTEEGEYQLRLQLPFTEKDIVDISRRADELFVKVGPYKRNVFLPQALARRSVTRAALEEGELVVCFE